MINAKTEIKFDMEIPAGVPETSINSNITSRCDFMELGIGGLDNEMKILIRRVINSHKIPAYLREIYGIKHVRGMLLYGPPGTGKSLIASKIGQMLNACEIKTVNVPEILNKNVGVPEENMRNVFAEAEKDEKEKGSECQLHVIIFDEIEAICKHRPSSEKISEVNDRVVNKLLSKIDGVEALNNILIIGITNRKDLIDEVFLRTGRLEVHIETSLPNMEGRKQLLEIHTKQMKVSKKLDGVNIAELARLTTNFTGAEIEGLVRAARDHAFDRFLINQVNEGELDNVLISQDDFNYALENAIIPVFGTNNNEINRLNSNGIIPWGDEIMNIRANLQTLISLALSDTHQRLIKILITGETSTGKTALSAQLAMDSYIEYVQLCSPNNMLGLTENNQCLQIKTIFDNAYNSTQSCIIIDDIERLLGYSKIGNKIIFSKVVLQTLLVLLKKEPPLFTKCKKLLILCTACLPVVHDFQLRSRFNKEEVIPNLTAKRHILNVIQHGEKSIFSNLEIILIRKIMPNKSFKIGIKTMLNYINTVRQIIQTEKKCDRVIGFFKMICEEDSETYEKEINNLIIEQTKPIIRGLGQNVLSYNAERFNELINSMFDKKRHLDINNTIFGIGKKEYKGFEKKFKEPILINKGEFGEVIKATNIKDNKEYAIKIIPYKDDQTKKMIMREMELMSKLKSKFIVEYKKSWIEETFVCSHHVFLQMELCRYNLYEFKLILLKQLQCETYLFESIIGFIIMSEIIEELFEGVNYLHQNNIIHRDLKPQNILISDFTNGITVKIADFGLSCIHKSYIDDAFDRISHTGHVGNLNYIAPELGKFIVRMSDRIIYDEKVDVYSLGMITRDFFGLCLDINYPNIDKEYIHNHSLYKSIESKLQNLCKVSLEMSSYYPRERPGIGELLESKNNYFVNLSDWNTFIHYMPSTSPDQINLKFGKDKYANFILSKFSYCVINEYPNLTVNAGISVENKHSLFSIILENEIVKSYNGFYYCILRSLNGKLYSFGENKYNQLGYETSNEWNYTPESIKNLENENVIEVSCGRSHTIALTKEGELFSWGSNNSGEIARNIIEIKSLPEKVIRFNGEKIKSISCGSEHSMALTVNGNVFSWGNNRYGQLGVGNTSNLNLPTRIDFFINVTVLKISCGRIHSLLLSKERNIFSFGANYNCQLGFEHVEDHEEQTRPRIIYTDPKIKFKDIHCHWRADFSTALSNENKVYIWGKCGNEIIDKPTISEFDNCAQAVNALISENIQK